MWNHRRWYKIRASNSGHRLRAVRGDLISSEQVLSTWRATSVGSLHRQHLRSYQGKRRSACSGTGSGDYNRRHHATSNRTSKPWCNGIAGSLSPDALDEELSQLLAQPLLLQHPPQQQLRAPKQPQPRLKRKKKKRMKADLKAWDPCSAENKKKLR